MTLEFGFLPMICFVFYMPTFFHGPLMNYDSFYNMVS